MVNRNRLTWYDWCLPTRRSIQCVENISNISNWRGSGGGIKNWDVNWWMWKPYSKFSEYNHQLDKKQLHMNGKVDKWYRRYVQSTIFVGRLFNNDECILRTRKKNATLIIIPIPKFGTNMLAFTHSRVKSSTVSIRILLRSFTIKWNV